MATLYVETSIISYLRPKVASQIVAAARQLLTRRWWDEERQNYELVTSQYVLDEAAAGDASLSTDRLKALDGIPLLPLDPEVGRIASEIISRTILPAKAQVDALHIAITAHHGIDYLLTWNCTHIANARMLPKIRAALLDLGCHVPIICTPEEMVDDEPKS